MKNRKKTIRTAAIALVIGVLAAAGFAYYLFNMPHRDVGASKTDYQLSASGLVSEYLNNHQEANNKYLDEAGESKILEVSGTVAAISEDFNQQKVILLKSSEDKAGVSCTFLAENSPSLANIQEGETIKVKGVIRAGASFDEDLEMYEHVILEKCGLVGKK